MPGFFVHNHGNDVPDPQEWPLAATQTYKSGDPVGIVANALTVCHTDAVKVLDTELIGFAATGALGEQSATRTGLTYGGTGNVGGNSTGTPRSFYPAAPTLILRTKNFWATGAAGTQQAKTGAIRGGFFQISGTNVADDVCQWGVENTAGVIDTDAVAHVIDVLDNNGQPIAVGTTLTAGDGYVVFRIIGNNQWAGGVATVAT